MATPGNPFGNRPWIPQAESASRLAIRRPDSERALTRRRMESAVTIRRAVPTTTLQLLASADGRRATTRDAAPRGDGPSRPRGHPAAAHRGRDRRAARDRPQPDVQAHGHWPDRFPACRPAAPPHSRGTRPPRCRAAHTGEVSRQVRPRREPALHGSGRRGSCPRICTRPEPSSRCPFTFWKRGTRVTGTSVDLPWPRRSPGSRLHRRGARP